MIGPEVSYTNPLYQQGNYYHYRGYPQSQVQSEKDRQRHEKSVYHFPQQQIFLTPSSWTSTRGTVSPPHPYTSGTSSGEGNVQWKGRRIRNGDIKTRSANNTIPSLWNFSNSSYQNNTSKARNYSFSTSSYNLSVVSIPSSVINYETLPKDDLSSLIDLHDFDFIMNQVPCNSIRNLPKNGGGISLESSNDDFIGEGRTSRPFLLILVHSAPTNFKKRLLIRETWGSLTDQSTRLIFLLGAVNSSHLQQSLEVENSMFSDMVQGNFIDAYRNMTYKHVMALKWFSYYCPEAKYVLKIDDDVFVNTPFLLKYLGTNADRQDFLFCQKISWARVKRSFRSKWRVSTREYSGRYYPPYCPGYSIIYSPDVAFRLYVEAQKTPYFWIDDVHVTGTLSQQANITITSFTSFILKKSDCEDILAGKTDINNFVFLFSWPDIKENQTRSLWNLIRDIR